MSRVVIRKTRRCFGFGELVAEKIAKGEIYYLPTISISVDNWIHPRRVLTDWIKKPTVSPNLGRQLLKEMSTYMEVVLPLDLDNMHSN